MIKSKILLIAVFATVFMEARAQGVTADQDLQGRIDDGIRIISPTAQFLNFSPDSRAAGMGDVGAATSADANSIFWNPAKLAFVEKDQGLSLSYTPWLRKLINDMSYNYLAAYTRISKEEVVGVSFTYFDMGQMVFRDINNSILRDFSPHELSVAGTYSRILTRELSMAIAAKYIYSNLSGSTPVGVGSSVTETRPGHSAAVDVGAYWNKDVVIGGSPYHVALGGTVSNIGAKMSYSTEDARQFLPGNLRIGTAVTREIDVYNKVTFALDASKLLVPTPPVYGSGVDENNTRPILAGSDPNRGLLAGTFGSFADAPGGFREEMQEIILSGAVEYWYDNLLAVRGGYFHESPNKGNRRYFTLGFGIRYQVFGFDFAYLVPVQTNHPLRDTLRFTLMFNINKQTQEGIDSITE